MAAIVERAPQAREVSPEAADFRFVARLEGLGTSGALARGTVSVEQQDRSMSRRDVDEAPCTEVVESMAVILSLILAGSESPPPTAPGALTALAPVALPPASAATTPAPPPPAEPAPGPTQTPPAPQEPTATKPPEPAPTPAAIEEAPAPPNPSDRLRWGLSLAGVAETGVAPSVAFGGQGGVDLWWVRDGVWSPSARVSARYVRSAVATTDEGSARFRLVALRAELCPLRWPARSSTFGRVCGLFDGGQLEADPQDDVPGETQTQTMPWLGGGGSFRLESTLADIVSLEAAADLVALGRADEFTVETGASDPQTVHQVPRISAMFSLGAVVRLP